MICTNPGCKGLVTWVPPGGGFPAHYRCQGPCGRPYKKRAMELEQIENPKLRKSKEVKEMTGAEKNVDREVDGPSEPTPPTKICRGCGSRKLATIEFFHRASNGKYGLNSMCKECRSKQFSEKWAQDRAGEKKRSYSDRRRVGAAIKPDPERAATVPVPVPGLGKDEIIATLEKKVQKILYAIDVIRQEL